MYGCESWTIKKAEHQKIDASGLWCWRRLLRVPWSAKRSNQSILKEINPEYSLEGLQLLLKLKLHILVIWCEKLAHWKRPWCWERLKAKGERSSRGWDGWMASLSQGTRVWANSGRWWRTGSLESCSPWGRKKLDTTSEQQQQASKLNDRPWQFQGHP